MRKHSYLATTCLIMGMAASTASLAQEANTPFATQGGLGDHIASRVLNMNGYNITNLNEPFFEADAVTLGYFNRNSGWNHVATRDMDFGGFNMGNIGDITLDGSTLNGGSFEAPAISHPKITGGTFSGISMRNVSIEVPRVTGGTFEAPAILSPTINNASISGGDISNSNLSDVKISGPVILDGGRITGLPAPEGDTDAMSLSETRKLIDESMTEIEVIVSGLQGQAASVSTPSSSDESVYSSPSVTAAVPELNDIIAGLDLLPGDLEIEGTLVVRGGISGVAPQFRAAPSDEEVLGTLDGRDVLGSLKKMDAVIYNLPESGLVAGIDPATIPHELSFIKKDGDVFSGIDYVMLIGPMIETITYMDTRISELEKEVRILSQMGKE